MFPKKLALFFALATLSSPALADPCDAWFRKSKLVPGPECLTKCATLSVGMNTFDCPLSCANYCKKPKPRKAWT